jgi:uncharacterized glyoxalase superfamily protein PhnB
MNAPTPTATTTMTSLSPNIFVRDIKATIAFYEQLGFQLTMTVPEQSQADPVWAMMINGGVTVMFQTFDSIGEDLPTISRQDGGSLLLYINVRDIRGFFDNIHSKVRVVKGLEKTFYGATEFSITDNNNYLLTFAENEGE